MSDLSKRMKATLQMDVISCGSSAFEYSVARSQFQEAANRIKELEANQCNEWHDKLSKAGLINYGDTPDKGITSIKAFLDPKEPSDES
jgi:hypothetical protein